MDIAFLLSHTPDSPLRPLPRSSRFLVEKGESASGDQKRGLGLGRQMRPRANRPMESSDPRNWLLVSPLYSDDRKDPTATTCAFAKRVASWISVLHCPPSLGEFPLWKWEGERGGHQSPFPALLSVPCRMWQRPPPELRLNLKLLFQGFKTCFWWPLCPWWNQFLKTNQNFTN